MYKNRISREDKKVSFEGGWGRDTAGDSPRDVIMHVCFTETLEWHGLC